MYQKKFVTILLIFVLMFSNALVVKNYAFGERLKNLANKITDTVGDTVGAVVDTVVDTGKKVVDTVVDTGKKVADTVVDTGKKVADTVVDTGKKVVDTVVDTGKKVADTVVDTGKKVVDTGKKAVDTVKQGTEKAVEAVGQAAQKVNNFKQNATSAVGNFIVDEGKAFGKTVVEAGKKIGKTASSLATKGAAVIKDGANTIGSAVGDTVKGIGSGKFDYSNTKSNAGKFSESAKTYGKEVGKVAKGAYDVVSSAGKLVWDTAKTNAVNGAKFIGEGLRTGWTAVKDTAKGIASQDFDYTATKNQAKNWGQSGKNFGLGVLDGVNNGMQWLEDHPVLNVMATIPVNPMSLGKSAAVLGAKAATKVAVMAGAKLGAKAAAKAGTKAGARTVADAGAKAGVKAGVKAGATTGAGATARATTRTGAGATTRTGAGATSRAALVPETRAFQGATSRAALVPETRAFQGATSRATTRTGAGATARNRTVVANAVQTTAPRVTRGTIPSTAQTGRATILPSTRTGAGATTGATRTAEQAAYSSRRITGESNNLRGSNRSRPSVEADVRSAKTPAPFPLAQGGLAAKTPASVRLPSPKEPNWSTNNPNRDFRPLEIGTEEHPKGVCEALVLRTYALIRSGKIAEAKNLRPQDVDALQEMQYALRETESSRYYQDWAAIKFDMRYLSLKRYDTSLEGGKALDQLDYNANYMKAHPEYFCQINWYGKKSGGHSTLLMYDKGTGNHYMLDPNTGLLETKSISDLDDMFMRTGKTFSGGDVSLEWFIKSNSTNADVSESTLRNELVELNKNRPSLNPPSTVGVTSSN